MRKRGQRFLEYTIFLFLFVFLTPPLFMQLGLAIARRQTKPFPLHWPSQRLRIAQLAGQTGKNMNGKPAAIPRLPLLYLSLMAVVLFGCGKGETKNVTQMTVGELQSAANNGNPKAMARLGLYYDTGRGIPQNIDEAARWYRKAASMGDIDGEIQLGYDYATGRSVGRNSVEAYKWFRLAAEGGNASAQAIIGQAYQKGIGVQKNENEALGWYKRSADQGCALGQYGVGLCFLKGIGTETNLNEGINWIRQSAEGGCDKAQVELAKCYGNGIGVETNPPEAFNWFLKAALQGNPMGEQQVSILYACVPALVAHDENDGLIESCKWISLTRLKDPQLADIAINILQQSSVIFTPEQTAAAQVRVREFLVTNQLVLARTNREGGL